ncbi:MAG: hypothetical protein KC501_30970 [Myxococcales bacterium]|nr:hypothetical protein [Myxococcales bacterium]
MNRRFLRSLHEEHLEEISALYERRIGLLDDTEIDHDDILGLEARIEAHLDALVVGAEPALELCAERSLEGDAGELFGALCVFFRQGRQDLFEAALARFAPEDEEAEAEPPPAADDEDDEPQPPLAELLAAAMAELQVAAAEDEEGESDQGAEAEDAPREEDDDEEQDDGPTPEQALGDALAAEGPPSWQSLFERLLEQAPSPVVAGLARAMAVRGIRMGPKVVAAAERLGPGPAMAELLWSLGRARERTSPPLLSSWARRLDQDEAAVATLGLLRFGDPSILDFVGRVVPTHPWALSLLAIAGGPSVGPVIAARLARAEATAEEIVAAGLFGDPALVPELLERLEGEHPEAAAQALYLVTGAPIFETVIETVVEADERELLPNGEPDPRDEVSVERLAQDPALWRQWWSEHQGAFASGRRHRLGRLASPEALALTLDAYVLRRPVRQLAAEELGLRYLPQRDLDVDQWARLRHAAHAGVSSLRSDAVIARADGMWVFARAIQR